MLPFPLPYQTRRLESHSISSGNPTGARGGVPPGQLKHSRKIMAGESFEMADIRGPGMIRSFWLTFHNLWGHGFEKQPEILRSYVLSIYWDDSPHPSVEAPIGDFFGLTHGRTAHYYSVYLAVNEGKGFNCFFPMPFSRRCRIVFRNDSPYDDEMLFYQIQYTLGDEVGEDVARFHAHFRREITPSAGAPFVMLDTRGSSGIYVGMNTSALPRSPGPWREGDFRFYIDGEERASIVGTGWSDWFQSAWGLGIQQNLYAGSNYQVLHPTFGDKYFCSSYRFHVADPIYFQTGLRIEHDPRGFEGFQEYMSKEPRLDDWCSTVYWYQHLTGSPLPPLPSREERIRDLEVPAWERKLVVDTTTRIATQRAFHQADNKGDVPQE